MKLLHTKKIIKCYHCKKDIIGDYCEYEKKNLHYICLQMFKYETKFTPKQPSYFYHGTSEKYLKDILKKGLQPKIYHGNNNFKIGNGMSRENLVYLTWCYAPYYAQIAAHNSKSKAVILKIKIPPKADLYPDEEYIWHALDKNSKNIVKRMENIDLNNFKKYAKDSIKYLGTIAINGIIKPEYIIDYFIDDNNIISKLQDPSISPLNYSLLKNIYRRDIDQLFS